MYKTDFLETEPEGSEWEIPIPSFGNGYE